ncbi:ABC transporter ATP-binding protein [Corynebacterium suranareeae]|uniref:ABC transporter ATP-binding protein n=1 Tax=Corynebacterium suranareeae TaxID=2506452 RepID=A0A160PRF8_9CORY|nr:ABC transporter ATP-binding protein [Corynebacterium suranareeae]
MSKLALTMSNVTVRRGEKLLLDDISLDIPTGSHWAVLGPNGAGKTTMLKIAATLLYPSEGTVDILGHRFGRVDTRELRKTIGLVDPKQKFSNMPAHEIVLSGLTASNGVLPRWTATDEQLAKCTEMIELVGMASRADRFWVDMSQGEKARTLIARALVISPALLLLDEPTTGLDLPGRETLLGVIDTLRASMPELTTVMITHHVEEIAASTTNILMIKDARVLAAGTVEEVMTPDNLGALYDMSVALETVRGRWFAFEGLH